MREPLLRIRFLTRVVVVMLSMVRAILYRMVNPLQTGHIPVPWLDVPVFLLLLFGYLSNLVSA